MLLWVALITLFTGSASGEEARAPSVQGGRTGAVVETMDTGGYTYVNVDVGEGRIWVAAPQFEVKVGDKVTVPSGMPMPNYHSKTLNRTFDLVYFVTHVELADGKPKPAPSMGMDHSQGRDGGETVDVDLSGIEKADGGTRISDLFASKASLGGKEVSVRGKVVKFTASIMGKNWLHVRDGTGGEGANDLTITTDASAEVGNTVLVRGTVSIDKDFGFGYRYDLIIENAQVTVENP
jgi:hypothetical protein